MYLLNAAMVAVIIITAWVCWKKYILTENASIQTTEKEGNYNLSVSSWFNKERLVTDRSHLTGQCMCLASDCANTAVSPYVQMSNYMCGCIDVYIRHSTVCYVKMVLFLSK